MRRRGGFDGGEENGLVGWRGLFLGGSIGVG